MKMRHIPARTLKFRVHSPPEMDQQCSCNNLPPPLYCQPNETPCKQWMAQKRWRWKGETNERHQEQDRWRGAKKKGEKGNMSFCKTLLWEKGAMKRETRLWWYQAFLNLLSKIGCTATTYGYYANCHWPNCLKSPCPGRNAIKLIVDDWTFNKYFRSVQIDHKPQFLLDSKQRRPWHL